MTPPGEGAAKPPLAGQRFVALEPLLSRLVDRLEKLEQDHEQRIGDLEAVVARAARTIERALYVATLGIPVLVQVFDIVRRWWDATHGGT